MEKLHTQNIVAILLQHFPEFKASEEFKLYEDDLELPYLVLGAFGDFTSRMIKTETQPTIEKIFSFINEIFAESDMDSEVKNMFHIGVFEHLVGLENTTVVARKHLTGNALKWFEFALDPVNTPRPE